MLEWELKICKIQAFGYPKSSGRKKEAWLQMINIFLLLLYVEFIFVSKCNQVKKNSPLK
jgi:hypothetical protein